MKPDLILDVTILFASQFIIKQIYWSWNLYFWNLYFEFHFYQTVLKLMNETHAFHIGI